MSKSDELLDNFLWKERCPMCRIELIMMEDISDMVCPTCNYRKKLM